MQSFLECDKQMTKQMTNKENAQHRGPFLWVGVRAKGSEAHILCRSVVPIHALTFNTFELLQGILFAIKEYTVYTHQLPGLTLISISSFCIWIRQKRLKWTSKMLVSCTFVFEYTANTTRWEYTGRNSSFVPILLQAQKSTIVLKHDKFLFHSFF